jgi:hypothetical protein
VINIEHQTNDTDAVIENILIDFGVEVSNPANPTINFTALNGVGTPQTSTTNVFNRIHLRGDTNSTKPLDIKTSMSGEAQSNVYIERKLLDNVLDTNRFNFNYGTKRIAFADAATGLSAKFNVADLKFVSNWGRLRVWGADNPSASAAEYYAADYWVLFSVAGDGSVTITTTSLIGSAFTAGALGPTVTFPAQGAGSYTFEVKMNNYTNAGRRMKANLEIFSAVEPF